MFFPDSVTATDSARFCSTSANSFSQRYRNVPPSLGLPTEYGGRMTDNLVLSLLKPKAN